MLSQMTTKDLVGKMTQQMMVTKKLIPSSSLNLGLVSSLFPSSSIQLLTYIIVETGEEGESAAWVGRAKLYTMRGEGDVKGWKESGVGAFKFNVTDDEPKRARFVLRADGTHRLILNAAVSKTMVFGDPQGGKPGDGKLCFNTPTVDGKVEMHLLKVSFASQTS
jgi:Ran-binding protein 3